jgi:hypothetical protein
MFKDSDIEVIAQMLAANPPEYDLTKGPAWESRISTFLHQANNFIWSIMTNHSIV